MWLPRWPGPGLLGPWLLLITSLLVPHLLAVPLKLRQAEFTNGWGTSRALSKISNVEFRVSSGGSVALCSLAFDTNLRKIDFAEVSCQLLQSFNADSSFFGLTEHSWTFFTSLDEEVSMVVRPASTDLSSD